MAPLLYILGAVALVIGAGNGIIALDESSSSRWNEADAATMNLAIERGYVSFLTGIGLFTAAYALQLLENIRDLLRVQNDLHAPHEETPQLQKTVSASHS